MYKQLTGALDAPPYPRHSATFQYDRNTHVWTVYAQSRDMNTMSKA